MRILGIESSCDETAAAIVEDGARILSNVVASQMATHHPYGGVVPELASREHLRAIVPVVRQAFELAGLGYADVAAVAVTQGPGLVGSLLVGITYAKALALSLGLPLIGVNHLEGHVHAVLLEQRMRAESKARSALDGAGEPEAEFPALVLVVSGGHTLLLLAEKDCSPTPNFRYRLLGRTRDDAAGEAFDKVAKLLSLGYPGGPIIDRLARHGNPRAVAFTPPKTKGNPLDLSFSGIKTAVLRHVEAHGLAPEAERRGTAFREKVGAAVEEYLALASRETLDLIASFQSAVVEDLLARTRAAAGNCYARSVIVSGGVASNSLLRERFRSVLQEREGLPVCFPSPALSTDNAAMIAAAAFPKFAAGEFAGMDLAAQPQLPLGG